MSALANQPIGERLYWTRIEAGIPSRELAENIVHQSATTIGRHERGESELLPSAAVDYADGYRRDDFLIRYCASCPVGEKLRIPPNDWGLQGATMRLSHLFREHGETISELERIAFDGIIDSVERPRFEKGLDLLKQVQAAIEELRLAAFAQIKKTAQQSG